MVARGGPARQLRGWRGGRACFALRAGLVRRGLRTRSSGPARASGLGAAPPPVPPPQARACAGPPEGHPSGLRRTRRARPSSPRERGREPQRGGPGRARPGASQRPLAREAFASAPPNIPARGRGGADGNRRPRCGLAGNRPRLSRRGGEAARVVVACRAGGARR